MTKLLLILNPQNLSLLTLQETVMEFILKRDLQGALIF